VTRVWLPDQPEAFGGIPGGLRADVWEGGEQLPDSAADVEFVVVPFGAAGERVRRVLSGLPRLKVVQLMSAGADHVLPYLPPGVTLCNARGAHTPATAEWAVGAIIAALRQFPRFAIAQHEGRWDTVRTESVSGKHVLIVGYGSIGEAVERRLAGWEVTVERVSRSARPAAGGRDDPAVLGLEELAGALPRADVVVILVPTVEDTRNMVDAKFLAAMKDGALLVNAARGTVVDTDALIAELSSGRLRAALDVTAPEPLPPGHPLWSAPGLLLTPHVGGAVRQARDRAYQIVAAQLARFAAGQPLANVIGQRGY
jgi:phosphoglycerate dehydrogenase-like enzyme